MCFGQPVELFHAATQAYAKHFAAAKGDQCMRELVALAQRVLLAEGVQIRKHTLAPPGRADDHQRECRHQNGRDEEEHARIHAAQEQNAHGDDGHHHEGAHVGLGQQQHPDHRHRRPHGQHGAEEALLHIHLAHHVVGGVDEHSELGQLRRLKADRPQRQPAPRPVDDLAHPRHQHHDQHQQGRPKEPGGQPLPGAHGHLERQQRRHETHHQVERVAREEMGGRVVGKAWVARQRDGRRIHHHQSPGQQGHHHPQQGLVKTQHAGGGGRGLAVLGTAHAYGQYIGRLAARAAQPLRQALPWIAWGACGRVAHTPPPKSWPASCARACTVSTNTCARCA